jgi:hypothetical protein
VFHVQLRQGRNVARAFNLSEDQVRLRFLAQLRTGQRFRYADRDWDPADTRLIVLEGRELRTDELMLGRGWASAQKVGSDVTERLLSSTAASAPAPAPAPGGGPPLERLKDRIVGRLAAGPLEVREAVVMAGELLQAALVSDRVALAERAVWELLHGGAAAVKIDGVLVSPDGWREVLLAAGTWTGRDLPVVLVQPSGK